MMLILTLQPIFVKNNMERAIKQNLKLKKKKDGNSILYLINECKDTVSDAKALDYGCEAILMEYLSLNYLIPDVT